MSGASVFGSPIPLSEIESVLAWVDTFKLSRPTKKIHRDFSDAVLLAEILAEHYPKLVEMHNYPPRNSHALKLNNWMTLNRKVLKKLKLNLCCNTMEQLANCAPGVIERVLVMVRDKIRRDEELSKTTRDAEQNMSSGGSYYEACGDDENVLVVPVKTRVNGVLETIQQKVVNHEAFLATKEELRDAKDTVEILKQKVEHLDNLLKLKDERINELQKQLDRKQSRRKDAETLQNSIMVPFETPLSPVVIDNVVVNVSNKTSNTSIKLEPNKSIQDVSKIPVPIEIAEPINLPNPKVSFTIIAPKRIETESDEINNDIDRIHSNVFKEAELLSDRNLDGFQDTEEFKDSEPGGVVTIEDAIQNEIRDIIRPTENNMNVNSQEAVNVSLVKT